MSRPDSSFAQTLQSGRLPLQGIDPIAEPSNMVPHLFYKLGVRNLVIWPSFFNRALRSVVAPSVRDSIRDAIIPMFMFKWLVVVLPLWVYAVFLMPEDAGLVHKVIVTLVYWLIVFDNLEPYILGLHCLVHKPIFVPSAQVLQTIYVWVLGPAMGMVPETYYSHHIGVHHPMNNGHQDVSSTMMYRRDSVWHFLQYAFWFQFVHRALCQELVRLGNTKRVRTFLVGEGSFWAFTAAVFWMRGPYTALCFLVIPVVLVRLGMTTGNWGQHAFLNPVDPYTNHNQSCVIVNSVYNLLAFNDGYHIMHHCHPTAHYTQLPLLFSNGLEEMARSDSVVFDASKSNGSIVDWPSISILLLRGRYDILADSFVDVKALVQGKAPRPHEEIVRLLQARVRKIYME